MYINVADFRFRTNPMTEDKRRSLQNWLPTMIQTALLILTILGFAVATEHRFTALEECSKTSAQTLADTVQTLRIVQNNQVRVLALLDGIEKRHALEDAKR